MSCSEQEEYQSADEGEESSNQMDIELRASGVAPTPASKQSASGDCYNSVSGSGEAGILNPIICRSWIDDTRPLSANQQQMWSVLPTEPQSSAYNMVFALHLTGALDNNALRTAVAAIMERHTILRMRFFESDEGIVLGNILDTSSMPSPLHVYPESIAISEVTAVLEKEKKRVLDLSKGTVLAACLHAVDDGSSLLVITLHHAAADFWSIGVFNRELSQLYNAAMQGGTFDLIALPIQYGDYAAWQQDYLQSEGAVKEKQFWKSTLAGVPAMLQLPTDRPRPESPTGEGRKFSGRLNAELVRQAAQFASQNHINMQSVLLAAVQVLLMRYSGQDDLVIGVPTAGRDHLETRGLIGYFVNTMPVRCAASEDTTFIKLARNASQATIAALAHAHLPLQQIVELTHAARIPGANPLIQVMCQYMPKNDISQPKFAGLKMTEMRTGSLTQAKFDLAFHFSDGGEFAIEYMAELFDGATIERFAESLACLLTDALNNPVQSVFRLSMLGKEDLKLLQRFSKGAARPEFLAEPLVHQTFEVIVASSPSKTCLVYGENDLSCLEVNHRANRLAHWLIENGVKQETIVGVMVERSFDLIISILAILKSGGGYLPLDPSYPPERLAVYAEDAKAAIVLTQSHLLTSAAELGGDGALIKAIDTLDLDSYPVINPGIQIDSESTSLILFTSGSTGRPKGVQHAHRHLRDLLLSMRDYFNIGPDDVIMLTNTICFDVHALQIFAPLMFGAKLVLVEPEGHVNGELVTSLWWRHKVTGMIFTVPFLAKEYLNNLHEPYPHMRMWGMGGDAVPLDIVRKMQEVFPNIDGPVNSYGPTEGNVVTQFRFSKNSSSPLIGRPDDNVHCYIVDANMALVPVGVPGELLLSGPRLAKGYIGRPDLTDEKFVPNPCYDMMASSLPTKLQDHYRIVYRTGDLVRWRTDGNLEFLGRIDRQTKVNGVRIELGEIEYALRGAAGVESAVAAAVTDSEGKKRLVGYVTPAGIQPTDVLANCQATLLAAMVPNVIVTLDSFPLLPNGKVDVRSLPSPDFTVKEYVADDGVHGIDGDDDEVSVAVKLAWREVFGGSISFGPSLDFFSQGGTSLDVMRANAAIADSLGLANSPATTLVYKTRTLEATIEGVRELYQSNKCKVGAGSAAGERKEWQNPSLTAEDWPDATRPLSAGQEQMWTLATLIEPEFTSAYVVGEAFRIVGSLDISKLQQALTLVASRHEVLRTRYAMVGKNRGLSGIVTMADVYKVNLRRVYLEKDEHRQLQEALRSEFSMPWDLEAGPLMRAALIQTPNSIAAVLCISLHHAVSDDWSLTVFCRELSVFYNFLSQETQPEGAQVPLEPLSVQYADFAAWQKKKSLSVKHNQLEYWRGVLKGAPPVLQLPTDHPRPIVPSLKGSTLSNLSLPPGLLQKLRNLASDLKISLAALTLAVYHTLLAKICDTNDVVVGVPVAQRGLSAVQPLVGYFITPVAVRASLDPKSPFKDVANAVQSGLAGAMDNSDISFQDIVQGLGLGSVKRSHTPVFQVMFNFTDDPELALNLSDSLEATRLPLPDLGTSQFELTMLLVAGEGSGSIQVEYFTSIFNASTVSGIVDNYISLLSSVVASPETPLRQLEMISESQRAELAAFSTGPDRKDFIYGPLVHEQFATRAAAAPKAPCLLFKGEVRTYGDVIAAVDQLAARLIKAGVVPFSVVGVMMPRSPALVIAMLATMKAGGVYLPLDTSLTPGRLAAYVKEGAPAVLLVAETTNVEAVMAALPPQLQKPSVVNVEEYNDTSIKAFFTANQVQLSGADVAALVFAAGPAGRPYGVEITHAGLRDLVGWTYNESIGTSIEDVYALTMAVSSSTNMATVLAALAAGAAVAILPPGEETNADAVASFCVSSKVTILEQSPMALEIYVPRLKAASSKLDIRAIILRGELPKTTLIAALKDALPFANENILSMYGMNEFSTSAITSNYGYMHTKIVLGLPDPNVQVYVVHPEDVSRLQPVGMRGELLLTGVRLARGYWKNHEMTSERFLPNPFLKQNASKTEHELFGRVYRTGDLVSWDREGQLCYHGLVNPNANKIGVRFGEGQDGKSLSAEDKAEVARFALGEERRNFFTHPLVHEAFEAIATSSPTQKCLYYEGKWLTYRDVALRSAALALKLNALGVGPGVPVGIMLDRSFDLMISILAAFRAGGCYVPCDPSFPDGRLHNYLEDSKATVVLTHTKDTERARGIVNSETVQVVNLADYDLEKTNDKSLAALDGLKRAGSEDPAYIIFTSGSTGNPKGVVIPHRSLRDHALGLVDYYNITSNDTCLLSSVINFDAHIMQSVPPLVVGAGLVIARPDGHIDPEYMSNLIASGKVTHALTTPSLALVQFRGHEVATCTSLRCMLIGGEAMQREVINLFAAKLPSCRVFNVYGPTEAGISAVECHCPPTVDLITLGRPVYNMHTYVVDSELRPVALGVPGELLLSGPRLALHYAGQPELTADKFIPNPCIDLVSAHIDPSLALYYRKAYRTGDLVRWCSDGTLEYLGRIDRQVKVMGVRIELGEVENALSDAPGITSAAVTAITLAGSKTLVGFVTPDTADTEAALVHCRNMVLPSAIPSKLIALKSFPLLPSGKADVKALEQIALDANLNANGDGDDDWYVPPSTDLEVAIARVWHEVLLIPEEEISVQADFFSVGGNSLKAGILTSHLRSTLNMPRLQATTVYTGKSVRGMAALIEKSHEGDILRRENDLKGSNSILQRLTIKAPSKATTIVLHPHADDVRLELLSVESPTRLPYWAYLILQWLMLALLSAVQPILWGSLLAMLFSSKRIVGWGGVVGLWPVMRILSLVINAILLLALKWILVGRLNPGVYPLHGWMYARWVTLRALQSQMSTMLLPILKRTTLLPWLLRGLGAKIESPSTTLIESLDISDFDLITLGKGSCIYHAAVVTGAFVAPAGYLRRDPVLVLSPVVIGKGCHIGCNSVVSAGTTIPDSHNLKPHASPAHPGDAPVAGPLSDHPHFTPEERLPTIVNLAGGLLVFIWEALAQEPAIALSLYLIAVIVGRVPLLEGLFVTYQAWQLVAFGTLFAIFYRLISPVTCMAAQALAVFVWKWCFVGRLTPGRNLAKSKLSLFNYSVLRRLVEHQRWGQVQEVFAGTPAMAAIYRSLGAKIGRQVFLGLSIVDFDAVTIHDNACSGSSSRILAADDDGIIEQVTIRREATIGNTSTLYPGCDIGERAVIGNDTPICKDRTVPLDTRVMGSIQYSVGRRRTHNADLGSVAEKGEVDGEIELGLPTIVKNSARGVDAFDLPLWHSALVVVVLLIVEPIAPIVGWIPVAAIITMLQSGFIYLIIVAYPILITVGWVLAVITLRLMLEISGIRRLWAAGSASCFNLRALVIHSWFSLNPSGLNALNGTPFMVWIFRALGFSVGSGAVILGMMPLESALVSVGKDSVLEAQSMLDGHYLEFARFIYNPLKVGKACWVQEGARVMPATELKDGSRVLPSSLVLPGDTLEKDMIWGGLPAEPLGPRPNANANNPQRKLLRSGRIGDSANRNFGRKSSSKRSKGMSGFLGALASSNQKNSADML